MRWQGISSGTGLAASALAAARTARGRPACRAIHPYGRVSPRGMVAAAASTDAANGVRPRRSRRTRPARPVRSAVSSPVGGRDAGSSGRPNRARKSPVNSSTEPAVLR
jgi:hypothetical protein